MSGKLSADDRGRNLLLIERYTLILQRAEREDAMLRYTDEFKEQVVRKMM